MESTPSPPPPAQLAGRQRLEALTRLLADESQRTWDEVRRQLEDAGPSARPALLRATRSASPRARSRARLLLLRAERQEVARRLTRAAVQPDLRLDRGLWLASRFHSPTLDPRPYRRALAAMQDEVRRRVEKTEDPIKRCTILRDYLGKELGFGGSIGDYHHPDNCCLYRAIERRAGLPLTLGAIYVMVAEGAGLSAALLPMPGHVMVRMDAGDKSLVLDPHNGGKVQGRKDLARLFAKYEVEFDRGWLSDAPPATIIRRQLFNIVHSLMQRSLNTEARMLRPALVALERPLGRTSS